MARTFMAGFKLEQPAGQVPAIVLWFDWDEGPYFPDGLLGTRSIWIMRRVPRELILRLAATKEISSAFAPPVTGTVVAMFI